METFEQQKQFFEAAWPEMQSRAESGGGHAVIDFISSHTDDQERRVLFSFARQGLVHREWQGRNFDDYIAVAEAGIQECLRQAEAAGDEETRKKRINAANVISYNLGADLAFCWGDGRERSTEHLRRGLKAGHDCLRWRRQLGNPYSTHSMAHWLRGIHRLALGDSAGAQVDFEDSLQFAELSALQDGKSSELEGRDGSVVLAHGCLAQARLIQGDEAARPVYERVIAMLEEDMNGDDEELREDSGWYCKQLKEVERLLLSGQSAAG